MLNFTIGLIAGMLGHWILSYLSEKGKNLATKEDIAGITKEIEQVTEVFKNRLDLSKTERDLYVEMIRKTYSFSSQIKRYELQNNKELTMDMCLRDPAIKEKYLDFMDAASEFVGKSYIFLSEQSYSNLKDALKKTSTFAGMHNSLLDAMRKSIYPDTKLSPQNDLTEYKY